MPALKYLLEVTMEAKMSGSTPRELLSYTRKRYSQIGAEMAF